MATEIREILREANITIQKPSTEDMKKMVDETCHFMSNLLRQEYKIHEGEWWLWSLGEPRRPLSISEIDEAIQRGDISP
jgi:hypothetical protein